MRGIIDALTINEENKLRREVKDLRIKVSEMDELRLEIEKVKEKVMTRHD